jgi:hypothetical protein
MLRLSIELFPSGKEDEKKLLSQINIGNTGDKNPNNNLEHEYSYTGWVSKIENDDIEHFIGTAYHNRKRPLYLLIFKIVTNIIDPYIFS